MLRSADYTDFADFHFASSGLVRRGSGTTRNCSQGQPRVRTHRKLHLKLAEPRVYSVDRFNDSAVPKYLQPFVTSGGDTHDRPWLGALFGLTTGGGKIHTFLCCYSVDMREPRPTNHQSPITNHLSPFTFHFPLSSPAAPPLLPCRF